MAAYIIARVEVRHMDWREAYAPKTGELVRKHGGKVLTGFGSAMETLEGDAQLPSAVVIIEFPSLAQAKAWYNDPEYAPMITLRQSGAEADIIVVDGR